AVTILRGSSRELWIKQLDHGPASKLTDDGSNPSWSPDGRFVVFSSQSGMMRGPADGSALPTRMALPMTRVTTPELSRDGSWIVFASVSDLFAVQTSGDTTLRVLVDGPFLENSPTVSPD